MTQEHPITPPPELIKQWYMKVTGPDYEGEIARRAAQWGADQELEACVQWLDENLPGYDACEGSLRAARRPKPPSLKEQGLKSLDNVIDCIKSLVPGASVDGEDIENIRHALEGLPE